MTSDPLKFIMEDIEKTQTLSRKFAKIQKYLDSLKQEMSKIKDLHFLISKQFLDHAIRTLEVEHDSLLEKLKTTLNEAGITDGDVLPEEMIRFFQNPSLNQRNTGLQAPQLSMQNIQQGFGQQGLLHHGMWLQGFGPQLGFQQGFGQQGFGQHLGMGLQGSLQMNPSQLQQAGGYDQVQQEMLRQNQMLVHSQMMNPSQVLPQQEGQQVLGQEDEEDHPFKFAFSYDHEKQV